jgi:hypothetical protein
MEAEMRKHFYSSVLLLMILLFAGSIARAATLTYNINNNSSEKINIKFEDENGNTKKNVNVPHNDSTTGSYTFAKNSYGLLWLHLKIKRSGSNNNIGCRVRAMNSYPGYDRTVNLVYGADNIFKVSDCGAMLGCQEGSCTAEILNPE